jgi:TDG/mug DNA glycosylase family protein
MKIYNNISKPLPDLISKNLKVLFVGYNPGLTSAEVGHHYANRSNRFWKLLYESGLTPYMYKPKEDVKLLNLGFGSTNLVNRESKNADEISQTEYKEGSIQLLELINEIRPKIVCYVGYGIYRIFKANITGVSKNTIKVVPGIQEDSLIQGIKDFVCSNPSGLNTIPYEKQLQNYIDLKKLIAEVTW